jgi:putative mRNA 3-end processing factor
MKLSYQHANPGSGATDIEAVFLAGATSENVPETLTDIVGTALERAQEGSTTLVTASGLSGVHIAYLLGYVSNRVGGPSVTVVGQAAKLYEGLDYAAPNVSSVPEFRSPTEVLASGRVTVAGPEVPVDGSAARLFEYISDDPGATLLQVTSGGTDPVDGGECTVYTRTFSQHPTDTAVDTLVDELDPIEVVIVHQSSQKSNRFKDRYEALTWATDDYEEYTLYDDGWQGPPWVHDSTVRAAVSDGLAPRFAVEDLPVPSRAEVDLAAEGLDIGRLESLLASPDPPDGSETGARTAPDDTAPAERDALDAIESRLSAIEALVSGHRIRARVVDAGGGVMLLRVLDADCDLDDGEVIEASIRDTSPAGGEMDDA